MPEALPFPMMTMTLADSLSVAFDVCAAADFAGSACYRTACEIMAEHGEIQIAINTDNRFGKTGLANLDPFQTEWQWWLDNTWSAVCQADNELAIYQAEIDALIAAL